MGLPPAMPQELHAQGFSLDASGAFSGMMAARSAEGGRTQHNTTGTPPAGNRAAANPAHAQVC